MPTTFYKKVCKIDLFRGTTSYVPDTQPMAYDPPMAEQEDIVICETSEESTDELENDCSIEDKDNNLIGKQMELGSERYLISNISK